MWNGQVLRDEVETLAERLQKPGAPRGVVASFPVSGEFGFAQGFDAFDEGSTRADRWSPRRRGTPSESDLLLRSADDHRCAPSAMVDRLGRGGARGHGQFLWVHYFDAHGPYGEGSGRDLHAGRRGPPVIVGRADAVQNSSPGSARGLRRRPQLLDQQLDRLLDRLGDRRGPLPDPRGDRLRPRRELRRGGGDRPRKAIDRGADPGAPPHPLAPRLARRAPAGCRIAGRGGDAGGPVGGPHGVARVVERPRPDRRRAGPAAVQRRPDAAGGDGHAPHFPEREGRGGAHRRHRAHLPRHRFFAVDASGRVVRGNAEQVEAEGGGCSAADRRRYQRRFRAFERELERSAVAAPTDEDLETLRALGYLH